jgi:hypothetical protein
VGNSRLWLDQAAEFVIPLVSSDLPKPVGIVFPSKKKLFKIKSDHEFIAKAACSFFGEKKRVQTCQQVRNVSVIP